MNADVVERAPAKLNLYLHVGPLRADGLHDLASLFVYAEDGDLIEVSPAADLRLDVTGPFAAELAGFPVTSNLVWRAAALLRQHYDIAAGARIVLHKNLPIASGIGGGSADAAAALRALARLWRIDAPTETLARLAFRLGADIPACLYSRPAYVDGAGEKISKGPSLPPISVCLVNPRVATPTGPIFRAFDTANPHPAAPARPRRVRFCHFDDMLEFLQPTRNDLEKFAIEARPVIGAALEFVADCSGSRFARMSGSGATVFGLFADESAALRAAHAARARGWWALGSRISRGDR